MMSVLMRFRHITSLIISIFLAACASSPATEKASHQEQDVKVLAVDLHRDHGWAAIRAERFDEAASYFKRILQDNENDMDAILGLGEASLGQDRLDEALARFGQASVGDGPAFQGRAWQGQAIVWLRRGDHVKAKDALAKAIDLNRGLWRAWNGLGRVHDAQKDYTAARYAYRQAINLQPKTALLHNNLGFSLLASGDPVYAEPSFRRALELDPDLEVATSNLRLALALQGRYVPALAGVSAIDQARVMNNVGYAALLRGDLEKARGLFLNAMEVDPGFFKEARRNLAFLETLEADQAVGE